MSEMKIYNLNESGAKYPFKVPEDYFENLTARIMDRIPVEEAESTKIIAMKPRNSWKKIASIAASLIIVAVVSIKVFNTSTTMSTTSNSQAIAQMDESTLEEAELYSSMVDNYDIYTLLAENDYSDYDE